MLIIDAFVELFSLVFPKWFEEDEDVKNHQRRKKGAPVPKVDK